MVKRWPEIHLKCLIKLPKRIRLVCQRKLTQFDSWKACLRLNEIIFWIFRGKQNLLFLCLKDKLMRETFEPNSLDVW
jgi:hypothetical protein